VLAVALWLEIYQVLQQGAQALVGLLPVDPASHLGAALELFFYDTPKVLLTGIVFVMGMVNSCFTPKHTRALLAGRSEGVANVMAAWLGIVTPFCSCSAVTAGIPMYANASRSA
jgi:hypothetical protein